MSCNFVVKRCHNNLKMMSVFCKMAGVNAEYFKVRLNLFSSWHINVQEKESNKERIYKSVPQVTVRHHLAEPRDDK